MSNKKYKYVIVGGGLAGASAVEGIRERDANGSILLIGEEPHLPYHRPPLTKGLWTGKKKVEDILVQQADFYSLKNVEVRRGVRVISLAPETMSVTDNAGTAYGFEKLLLATGGVPNRLRIPGGDLQGILYYRYLEDYLTLEPLAKDGKTVLIIGGGFIGTEIAAALTSRKLKVTMVFPASRPCNRIFPDYLGEHVLKEYLKRGITVLTGDVPMVIEKKGDSFRVQTKKDLLLESDIIIAGIGITPSTELAQKASLAVADGIIVNPFLQTSHPNVYAAGDNTWYPDAQRGVGTRVEHWDNALNQGKLAGKNMAGAEEPYSYMPYFFSDLFDFGYEAVGEIDSRLETRADWQKENEKGIVYYLKENAIRGVLLCNVWDKVDAARASIRNNEPIVQERPQETV
jgi:3-phenylpropionate/trans-cinnamate dioxygenase ferredoxin reductase component